MAASAADSEILRDVIDLHATEWADLQARTDPDTLMGRLALLVDSDDFAALGYKLKSAHLSRGEFAFKDKTPASDRPVTINVDIDLDYHTYKFTFENGEEVTFDGANWTLHRPMREGRGPPTTIGEGYLVWRFGHRMHNLFGPAMIDLQPETPVPRYYVYGTDFDVKAKYDKRVAEVLTENPELDRVEGGATKRAVA